MACSASLACNGKTYIWLWRFSQRRAVVVLRQREDERGGEWRKGWAGDGGKPGRGKEAAILAASNRYLLLRKSESERELELELGLDNGHQGVVVVGSHRLVIGCVPVLSRLPRSVLSRATTPCQVAAYDVLVVGS